MKRTQGSRKSGTPVNAFLRKCHFLSHLRSTKSTVPFRKSTSAVVRFTTTRKHRIRVRIRVGIKLEVGLG